MRSTFLYLIAVVVALGFTACEVENVNSDVVIPKPNTMTVSEGVLKIENQIEIQTENTGKLGNTTVGDYLKAELASRFNISEGSGKSICLAINETLNLPKEAYQLEVTSKGVDIQASNDAGLFYGVQSLLQLMNAGKQEGAIKIQKMKIADAPRFGWRSYMLDEARYFFGEPHIYKLLDAMAELKLNVLHWHLTDDAGWRIESKKYPLLTEVGSKRADSEIGRWGSGKTSGEPHGGFYTQKQIKEIVAYAKARNIKVIPEIEMPGHASASVAAYPWLSTKNEKIDVPILFGKHYYTYDVIDPRVQEFLKEIVVEMIALFETDVVHIGGDEVRFNHWEEDPAMQAHLKKNKFTSYMDIQIEFTNNMSKFIESQGCRMMGWNEILGKNLHADDKISFAETSTKIAPNVLVQYWKGDIEGITQAAQQGYSLVNSHHMSTYLDYDYKTIPLTKAYAFDPIPEGLAAEHYKNIIGFGCQMWTEWTPTIDKVYLQTFPRIAAYAEVGWTNLEQKDMDSFVSRLKPMVKEWKKRGFTVFDAPELKEEEAAPAAK